jgi:peptidoglycan/xylan/chitin deacetylase (PgdA/CDA1 family)
MMLILSILFITIVLAAVLWLMGNYTFWLPSRSAEYPRIVMLHQVNDSVPASGMNMPPEKFEQLLQLLKKLGYQSHFVSEIPHHTSHRNWVCLTFDDGFMDNFTQAFPLLQKYHMKATIYLATQIPDIEKLDAAAITTMQQSGLIEFGSHTQDHVNLLKLDNNEARDQIAQSKQQVEKLVGHCDSFAYPFGRYDQHHVDMVRELGFTTAVSTRKKIEPVSANNTLQLPRISTNGMMNRLQMRIALVKGRYKL